MVELSPHQFSALRFTIRQLDDSIAKSVTETNYDPGFGPIQSRLHFFLKQVVPTTTAQDISDNHDKLLEKEKLLKELFEAVEEEIPYIVNYPKTMKAMVQIAKLQMIEDKEKSSNG